MSRYELAQLNIGVLKGPLDSPLLADFVANLDRINALAESSPGFVWRLQTSEGDATALRPLGDDTLINMSVWKDIAALRNYVYRSAHTEVMRRRKEWFEQMSQAYMVLWWVPKGHQPSIQEAIAKLELLRRLGPSPEAFSFRQAYLAPDARDSRGSDIQDGPVPQAQNGQAVGVFPGGTLGLRDGGTHGLQEGPFDISGECPA